eukprot:CAMPEP_0195539804 /NCGR_PEP_ID=MMETSP0794_2-20130614/50239_1 /TAXON_ID=515487 /ORGANISM="Stephanopyxis turris, Strain CCMP 815" /LENGTH=412 /DNA_ID=CAMNT_0040673857 /DNA_START=61 /DNA_END=1299 /DNA_ORIENTATION=+
MKIINISSVLLSLLVGNQGTHAGDPEIRFEKFGFPEGEEPEIQFPISESDATLLRSKEGPVSVVLPEDGCADIDYDGLEASLVEAGLYPPTHPEDEAFWDEFEEVVNVQHYLKTKKNNPCMTDPLPKVMPRVPQFWRGFDILDAAEAVHDEFPGIYHNQMIANWLSEGSLTPNNVVIPKFSSPDFINGPVLLSDMIGHAIRMVAPCDFAIKWSVGRARPEEIAWKITRGELDVPQDKAHITQVLDDMNLNSATDFTAYPEGCPRHPSWPAMHSAASAASFWLDVTQNLTEDQLCEARILDYSISYARTVAGVHYRGDNIAGLMVGQELIAQQLPEYLEGEYGADPDIVRDAIERSKYNWANFETSECYQSDRYKTLTAPKPPTCFDIREIPSNGPGEGTCEVKEPETCKPGK